VDTLTILISIVRCDATLSAFERTQERLVAFGNSTGYGYRHGFNNIRAQIQTQELDEIIRVCILRFMGINLEEFRSSVGVTQQDVADETGLSQGTISRIEKQLQRPSGEALLLIQAWADALAHSKRISVSQRLGWDWLMSRVV